MRKAALIILVMSSFILAAKHRSQSQSAELYLNTLHNEIQKFERKKKDFYLTTIQEGNQTLMETQLSVLNKEIEKSKFILSKIKPFEKTDNLLVTYKNAFDSLSLVSNTDFTNLLMLKKYINRTPADLEAYYIALSATEKKVFKIEQFVAKAEADFFQSKRIKGELKFNLHRQTDKDKYIIFNEEVRTCRVQLINLNQFLQRVLTPNKIVSKNVFEVNLDSVLIAYHKVQNMIPTIEDEQLSEYMEDYLQDLNKNYITSVSNLAKSMDKPESQLNALNLEDLRFLNLDYHSDYTKVLTKLKEYQIKKFKKLDVI